MLAPAFLNVLEFVGRETHQEVTLLTLRTFLYIAQRGVCFQREIEHYLGLSNATASRNVSYWTERRFDRNPGLGFVARTEDDYDRRQKNLTLTKTGRAFYAKLKAELEKSGMKEPT
ncbi:MarR Transcriptional regulators [uncultured Caudovirales phage]|uniref:MarR Transcriptional regulators n=1 Tax=uncultured Caudovirales phage TaxID=2100421 RepID=A0A6J5KV38_9CAUD|nr:MarR Transcriptional regulators [uncultured Caudovirales phage]